MTDKKSKYITTKDGRRVRRPALPNDSKNRFDGISLGLDRKERSPATLQAIEAGEMVTQPFQE